jgi:hypothetical protein
MVLHTLIVQVSRDERLAEFAVPQLEEGGGHVRIGTV